MSFAASVAEHRLEDPYCQGTERCGTSGATYLGRREKADMIAASARATIVERMKMPTSFTTSVHGEKWIRLRVSAGREDRQREGGSGQPQSRRRGGGGREAENGGLPALRS